LQIIRISVAVFPESTVICFTTEKGSDGTDCTYRVQRYNFKEDKRSESGTINVFQSVFFD
jgi:hypothetical protein